MSRHADQSEWKGTKLRWDIIKGDGVTTISFVHSGWEVTNTMPMGPKAI